MKVGPNEDSNRWMDECMKMVDEKMVTLVGVFLSWISEQSESYFDLS